MAAAMSSEELFKRFVMLLKMWPVDATKQGRCLGEYVRKLFNGSFKNAGLSETNMDVKYWSKVYADLKPIANNEYAMKYPREKATGALGLGKEQCKLIMSNTAMKYMAKEDE